MSTQAISFIDGAIKVGDGASPEVFTKIKEVQKGQFSGNKVDFPDVTNIDSPDNYREYIATFIDAGEFSFEANFIRLAVDGQEILLALNYKRCHGKDSQIQSCKFICHRFPNTRENEALALLKKTPRSPPLRRT